MTSFTFFSCSFLGLGILVLHGIHSFWAKLSGKALSHPVSLSQLLSEALPLVVVKVTVGERSLRCLLSRMKYIFSFWHC